MAGRPKAFNDNDVLNKAIDVFWNKGYEATSTEDLLRAMNINRGSLYHAFGSKKELFATSLDYFLADITKVIDTQIKKEDNPIEGIKALFMSLTYHSVEDHSKGCFFGNSLAELSNIDDALKLKITKSLVSLEELFYKYLLEAKEMEQLKTDEEPRVLARYLINLWNGINITRRMYPNKEDLASILKLQLSLLK